MSAIDLTLQGRVRGHKQLTHAYLLTLAIHRKSTFVTFDNRLESLAPQGSAEHEALVILRA